MHNHQIDPKRPVTVCAWWLRLGEHEAPGLTSFFQRSMNVHGDTLLFVPEIQCISSFVFYIIDLTILPRELCFSNSKFG